MPFCWTQRGQTLRGGRAISTMLQLQVRSCRCLKIDIVIDSRRRHAPAAEQLCTAPATRGCQPQGFPTVELGRAR